jgi:hypothetical protein
MPTPGLKSEVNLNPIEWLLGSKVADDVVTVYKASYHHLSLTFVYITCSLPENLPDTTHCTSQHSNKKLWRPTWMLSASVSSLAPQPSPRRISPTSPVASSSSLAVMQVLSRIHMCTFSRYSILTAHRRRQGTLQDPLPAQRHRLHCRSLAEQGRYCHRRDQASLSQL